MSEPLNTKKITAEFNWLLFALSAGIGIVTFLLSGNAKNVPFPGLVISIFLDVVRYGVMMLILAWCFRALWDRLITNLFVIRKISYGESISIVLIIGLLTK
jgi:hypothetical protein